MKSIVLSLSSVATALAVAMPVEPPACYHLNLLLAEEGDQQYWLLTEDNLPPGNQERASEIISKQQLARRDNPVCSGSHQASTGDCSSLLAAISNDLSDLPASPQDIRYNNCYVSWSKPVDTDGAVVAHLHNAALAIYNTCNSNNKVSGLKKNVNLNGVTLTECLSNRGTRCS